MSSPDTAPLPGEPSAQDPARPPGEPSAQDPAPPPGEPSARDAAAAPGGPSAQDAGAAPGGPAAQDAAAAPAEPPDRLPPALSSMWRLCRLGFHYEPALMGVAFVLALAAALPDALLAVWFTLLGEGLIGQRRWRGSWPAAARLMAGRRRGPRRGGSGSARCAARW